MLPVELKGVEFTWLTRGEGWEWWETRMQEERAGKFGFWKIVCRVGGSVAGTQGSNSQSS